MTQPIEFFYNFCSSYSYLAFTQLREMDVDIALRPMKLSTVMEKVGNVPASLTCPAKGVTPERIWPFGRSGTRHA
ncbi:hypothetical protein E2F50_21810 [Rhizobium deserti]|uniref:DSBA-like thioredoxin domain-containing protein n=1 Tax=Rhizobium deserti TaxID=2547961 RepID=A0A4R5U6G1_9HYPH|nr:DsbA family protein [Rhizobium deserti]TDK29840.1 hypothetical protein E2F50_21810 [Rhizobium deserti]